MNGPLIKETLFSVLEQDYPALEIIICDDASPDFNRDDIQEYIYANNKGNLINVQILINKINQGTVKNLNSGIMVAKGEFIKIIAGDDCYAYNDVISKQVKYLLDNPDCYLVVGNTVQCDEKMNCLQETGFFKTNKYDCLFRDKDRLLKYICRKNQNALATQALCFRKSFFDNYGLYDERFFLIEDLPMAIKIVQNEIGFGYINYSCVKHRGKVGVSSSITPFEKKRIKYYEDMERYFRLYLLPIKNKIGRVHIAMRHKVTKFRIEYSMMEVPSSWLKITLIMKYIIPLMYYSITNSNKVLNILKSRNFR